MTITCEICEVVTDSGTVYLDTREGTTHYTCDAFDCNCAFDNNGIELIEIVEAN